MGERPPEGFRVQAATRVKFPPEHWHMDDADEDVEEPPDDEDEILIG